MKDFDLKTLNLKPERRFGNYRETPWPRLQIRLQRFDSASDALPVDPLCYDHHLKGCEVAPQNALMVHRHGF